MTLATELTDLAEQAKKLHHYRKSEADRNERVHQIDAWLPIAGPPRAALATAVN